MPCSGEGRLEPSWCHNNFLGPSLKKLQIHRSGSSLKEPARSKMPHLGGQTRLATLWPCTFWQFTRSLLPENNTLNFKARAPNSKIVIFCVPRMFEPVLLRLVHLTPRIRANMFYKRISQKVKILIYRAVRSIDYRKSTSALYKPSYMHVRKK
jgi:hypothetical protein